MMRGYDLDHQRSIEFLSMQKSGREVTSRVPSDDVSFMYGSATSSMTLDEFNKASMNICKSTH